MNKFLFLLLFLPMTALAVLKEGPVHVIYADGSMTCGDFTAPAEGQDNTLGLGMRVNDLKLRPGGITVIRRPTPEEPEPPVDPPPEPPPEEPTPVWTTNISYHGTQATASRIAKYEIVREMVERTMNEDGGIDGSGTFKTRVLAYDSPYTTNRFVAASGSGPINKTNNEIYQHHWDGNETRPSATQVDNEADMEVEFYYANNSTVGYTYTSSRRIWVNTKFYDTDKPSSASGNFYHEWSHKLGYGHEVSSSNYRPYTVPYGIGYTMRDINTSLDDEYGY